jgi:hypothetical protein
MKRLLISIVLASAVFSVTAMAQSAKFTAAWEDDKVALAEFAINYDLSGDTIITAEETMATIHVANKKELLIGVSGVANLVTITEAKARNGGFESVAEADGALKLEVRVIPEGVSANCAGDVPVGGMVAAPGGLTFASRKQTLKVTVDLDIVDVVGTCGGLDQPDCVADTLEIVGDVTVALGLDTTAAHHFNFVAPDLAQGTYDVAACFTGAATGFVTEEEVGDNKVYAYVAVMQRMLTVQEVRAVKDDFIDFE